jgi:hypothetical protein
VGFSAALNRARDQKLGVFARQLVGGGLPVDGSCYKEFCRFLRYALAILLLYRGVPQKGM